ncbi:hypothetical protein [Mesorhizobium sp.]|uniref:hypothetical protein n=1 Tax=Mesorhizobium sp. TaxID=1871066 RepID=UPI000FE608D1|nr:hypothetical protein [Mesorhizobium sp.]RWO81059.1 MAG: hypothetical protein EOQ96_25865 [Mesorhizobium sp.]
MAAIGPSNDPGIPCHLSNCVQVDKCPFPASADRHKNQSILMMLKQSQRLSGGVVVSYVLTAGLFEPDAVQEFLICLAYSKSPHAAASLSCSPNHAYRREGSCDGGTH